MRPWSSLSCFHHQQVLSFFFPLVVPLVFAFFLVSFSRPESTHDGPARSVTADRLTRGGTLDSCGCATRSGATNASAAQRPRSTKNVQKKETTTTTEQTERDVEEGEEEKSSPCCRPLSTVPLVGISTLYKFHNLVLED